MKLYKFCGLDPVSFWDYTPAETYLMLQISVENFTEKIDREDQRNAALYTVIMAANGAKKSGKKPFTFEDFYSKNKSQKLHWKDHEKILRNATIAAGGKVVYR